MNKQLTVIGGGAAGMMAAICAARRGTAVTLLEPNERLGKKLNITGKGRCNVTNDAGCEELLANVPQNGRFLYSAFSRFDGRGTMAFFEELGVPLKVERGRRVFPVSDRAFDVSAALERELRRLRVTLVRDRAVCVLTDETGAVRGVKGEKGTYPAQAVVLATGGVSYRGTGSTGEGHRMAAMLGHTVTPLTGSLVPLRADGCAELQGLSLRNVGLTVYENGKKIYTDFGSCSSRISACPARWCSRPRRICGTLTRRVIGWCLTSSRRWMSSSSTSACCRIFRSTRTAIFATRSASFCRRSSFPRRWSAPASRHTRRYTISRASSAPRCGRF